MNLIEQLEKLPRWQALIDGKSKLVLDAYAVGAIIEQAKREAVEPVARVTALSNLGFSTMGQVEWIGNKYSLPPDALLYASPQPDHIKLIGELVEALDAFVLYDDTVGYGSYILHQDIDIDALLTKAREAIK